MSEKQLTLFGKVFRAILPVFFILGGGAAWSYFKATAPVMKKGRPKPQITMVQTRPAQTLDVRAMVSVMGTVKAAKEVTLKAQVAGVVESVSERFVPGGRVKKGEELILLDPADYEVNVKKAQSALDDAKAALAIEQGSQNIAREEIRLLTEISSQKIPQTDLALRKPQLEQARAAVVSAEADLTQARLNLRRTRVTAPFNAMVVTRSVNQGTYAGTQQDLVTLVGTDAFWVEAVVPLDQLSFIDFSHPGGCPVTLHSQSGSGTWKGRVLQVTGTLNENSRMATVIVVVDNPLGTPAHPLAEPLMIDDYVNVEITGRILSDVVALPRAALQDGNTLWVNQDDHLDIRKVTLAWKGRDQVYVKTGVSAGEEIVMSSLATPVQGMPLEVIPSPGADASQKKTVK